MIRKYGSRDAITAETLEHRYLQIDHRIPYEIAGNGVQLGDLDEFMLLDASSQRAKSWSCENCQNLKSLKEKEICYTCFWAFPENYTHVAMIPEKRLHIMWRNKEIREYQMLKENAENQGITIQDYIKKIIKQLDQKDNES